MHQVKLWATAMGFTMNQKSSLILAQVNLRLAVKCLNMKLSRLCSQRRQ